MAQSIDAHPDFISNSFTMNVLTPGTNEITTDSGQTIDSITSQSITLQTYAGPSTSYTPGSSFTSDVNYFTNDVSYSVLEGTIEQKLLDLSCSISGSTLISYSIANYLTSTVPSWITFDSSSGLLSITAPIVSTDSEYSLLINSAVSGVSNPAQKIIRITIMNCAVLNWLKWLSTSGIIWEIWKNGFSLDVGIWKIQTPVSNSTKQNSSDSVSSLETAQALSTTSMSIVLATSGCIVFASFLNASSVANLWLIINQLQILFLLLLTRAFVPEDIKTIITGFDFASNIYDYIPLKRFNIYPSILNVFEFNLSTSMFDPFGIKYESTIINSYPMFACLILVIIIHLCIWFLKFIFSKCKDNENCIIRWINWVLYKLFIIMTFGYYIRSSLEISQFILISSINEIYEFNISETLRLVSFVYAILMIAWYILILIIVNYLIFSHYQLNEENHNKLSEFFSWLQDN